MTPAEHSSLSRPAPWALLLAFAILYLAWGTTYLAIGVGVKAFPPALFGGLRITLAGLVLFAFLVARGQSLRLPKGEFFWLTLVGLLFFVGGNGLVTLGQKWVPSGVASVLVATTPLWMAVLELLWPHGERLGPRGWLGVFGGLLGVLLLYGSRLRGPLDAFQDLSPLLILGSAFLWSLGSLVLRHRRPRVPMLTAAAYQMLLGGLGLTVIGLLLGEASQVTVETIMANPWAIYSFFHLLVIGSLVGFVVYNWLLSKVSAPLAGTYAYVNPVVAILVGWLLGGEVITGWIVGGMLIILTGVALVRHGASVRSQESGAREEEPLVAVEEPAAVLGCRPGVKCEAAG